MRAGRFALAGCYQRNLSHWRTDTHTDTRADTHAYAHAVTYTDSDTHGDCGTRWGDT